MNFSSNSGFKEKLALLSGGNYLFEMNTLFTFEGKKQPLHHWAFDWNQDYLLLDVLRGGDYILNMAPDSEGLTLLHKIAKLPEEQGLSWLRKMKSAFISQLHTLNSVNKFKDLTILEYAYKKGSIWFLKAPFREEFVTEYVIKTELSFKQNWLHIAAKMGSIELLSFYLKNGVDANKSDQERRTPLMLAALHGHTECVKELILHLNQIQLFHKDIYNQTALHLALINGHMEIAELLLQELPKAWIGWQDRYGQSIEFLLERNMHPEIMSNDIEITDYETDLDDLEQLIEDTQDYILNNTTAIFVENNIWQKSFVTPGKRILDKTHLPKFDKTLSIFADNLQLKGYFVQQTGDDLVVQLKVCETRK